MSTPFPQHIFSITPDDNATIPQTQFIMVREAGDVVVETLAGDVNTLPQCQPGVQYAIVATKVLATDTTATGIIGLS
ncbi:MAG: spike base protein, RCAP_Rcc01079 family [Henriciella sp.]